MAYKPMDRTVYASEENKWAGRQQRDPDLFCKLAEGENRIRILPPLWTDDDTGEETVFIPDGKIAFLVYDHRNIPGTKDRRGDKETKRCIEHTYPGRMEECPICAAVAQLEEWMKRVGMTDAEKKGFMGSERDEYRLTARAYCNVLMRGTQQMTQEVEHDGNRFTIPKVRILGLPEATVYADIIGQMMRRNPEDPEKFEMPDPIDPYNGRDLIIDAEGSGMRRRYKRTQFSLSESPLHKDRDMIGLICSNANKLGLDKSMFGFPKRDEVDRLRTVGDIVLGLIGKTPEGVKGRYGSEEKSDVGSRPVGGDDDKEEDSTPRTASQPATESIATARRGDPPCFGNHVQGLSKCVRCRVEHKCSKSPATLKQTIEARKAYHAAEAAA